MYVCIYTQSHGNQSATQVWLYDSQLFPNRKRIVEEVKVRESYTCVSFVHDIEVTINGVEMDKLVIIVRHLNGCCCLSTVCMWMCP